MQRRGINDISAEYFWATVYDPDFAAFDRLIEDFADLVNAMKKLPEHEQRSCWKKLSSRSGHLEKLVDKFFDNPEKFKRQIENLDDLTEMAGALSVVSHEIPDRLLEKVRSDPDLVKKLMEKILDDPAEFKRTFEGGYELIGWAKIFPDYAEQLFAASKMLDDPEEFRRMITSSDYLRDTAELFPNHAEELIAKVLTDPVNFKHVITDSYDLRETAKQFPNEPILKAATYGEALKMVEERWKNKNLKQVGTAASTLGQGKRDLGSPFSMFPKDILIEIAKHTADPGVLSDEEKHKKAHESYAHPSERKPKK